MTGSAKLNAVRTSVHHMKLHCQASCFDVIITIKLAKTAGLTDANLMPTGH